MAPVIEKMTSRERTMAALAGEPVDRPPVCTPTNVATVELMDLVDAPFPEANRDAEMNARLAATAYTELGFDTIAPYFSIIQESSALGCDMQWEQKDNWPTVRMSNPIWKSSSDVKIPSDFLEHKDTRAITDSIRILKQEFGDEVAIVGKTMGPWTLAYHVFGVEPFLLGTVDDPAETMKSLEALKAITILYGQAQIDAGADVLTIPDHATGDLVSGEYYRRFLMEMHQEIEEELDVPLMLHICGATVDRMPYIAQTGMAAFHFDSKNDPVEAMAAVDGKIRLVGNINNPTTLYARGPEEVRSEVNAALDAGVQLIAPECAIPLKTKLENLLEIPTAIEDWVAERGQN
ncbi:MtaA/CmuA family methyltransferase [Candidatus Lucifugimonas marina]|jgi:[methyl-Co(III) methanol-specific corrinoid protein]:coenzyme M methyltransferase|uniref:MtaA/CmuA family methyltransferase n=2 Tax=Candidatus Lucifugimonas marina TaxID=3038979 RepID=A0AAJ5ZIK5_9CHLR|nr:MtaA/CmuA family methyltransferase [SAR202 cluster bacterium JH702]MDG0868798.1 MtaA/CmuA family methyltransferase [SAR202 cluster bacterium JH639]WFG35429.1 MtaA/CmuA family methyltransferase [SAR202 cluster bacterium JH545]WFG39376.1 MtaA/CmuA family methyltransferase [SAR202 cluster bacterium JH1073]